MTSPILSPLIIITYFNFFTCFLREEPWKLDNQVYCSFLPVYFLPRLICKYRIFWYLTLYLSYNFIHNFKKQVFKAELVCTPTLNLKSFVLLHILMTITFLFIHSFNEYTFITRLKYLFLFYHWQFKTHIVNKKKKLQFIS